MEEEKNDDLEMPIQLGNEGKQKKKIIEERVRRSVVLIAHLGLITGVLL